VDSFVPIFPINVNAISELSQTRCGFITDTAWSPDGFMLAVAHGGGIWVYEGGFAAAPTLKLTEHEGPVKTVTFNPTGLVMISGSTDTTVRLWIPNRGRAFYVYRGHVGGVNSVAVSPNGRVLASAGGDREIRLFDMMDSAASNILRGHTHEVMSVAFGLGGRVLVSGGWDKTARVWTFEPEQQGEKAVFEHPDWVRAVAVSADGKWLATACKDAHIRLFDLETCAPIYDFLAHAGGVDCLAFSPSGALLASGGRDNAVKFWDANALMTGGDAVPTPLHRIDVHRKPVMTVAFHPAGALLVSGSGDNTIRLWGVRA